MRHPARLLTLVVFIAALAACAPKLGVERLDDLVRAPNTGQLDVYESRDAVGRPYKTIAHLSVTDQKSARKKNDQYMQTLLTQAKEIGAEGVIILENGQAVRRIPDGMGGSVESTVSYAKAEAIVYQ